MWLVNIWIFLLNKPGANINAKTVDGDSALYLATYAVLNSVDSDLEGLRVLIKAGLWYASVNAWYLQSFSL